MEAVWTDDGMNHEIDLSIGEGVGGADYAFYDSDGDGRMDCWRDTTTSATNNSPFGQSSWRFHYGMDIGSVLPNFGRGAPIRAIASGRVTEIGQDSLNGRFIRILHTDGRESVYAHLLTQDVGNDAFVYPGFTIGTMNCTGSCMSAHGQNAVQQGTHLHLEIKAFKDAARTPENRIDPGEYMDQCG